MLKLTDTPDFFQEIYNRLPKGSIYMVGGWVRDSLLGIRSKDYDMATPYDPNVLAKMLKQAFPGMDEVMIDKEHIRFGVLKVWYNTYDYEITTFREEIYTPGNRKPKVTYTTDILTDLKRRDFTINAMAFDGEKIIDPYDGQGDLAAKELNPVGKTWAETYSEDPTRILRASRLAATLGFTFAYDPADNFGCYWPSTHIHNLVNLSPQILRKNFEKAWESFTVLTKEGKRSVKAMISDYISNGFVKYIVPFGHRRRFPEFVNYTDLQPDEAWFLLLWTCIHDHNESAEFNLTLLKKSMTMMGESKADIEKAQNTVKENNYV